MRKRLEILTLIGLLMMSVVLGAQGKETPKPKKPKPFKIVLTYRDGDKIKVFEVVKLKELNQKLLSDSVFSELVFEPLFSEVAKKTNDNVARIEISKTRVDFLIENSFNPGTSEGTIACALMAYATYGRDQMTINDAKRHCFLSMCLVNIIGVDKAAEFLSLEEDISVASSKMDIHNNRVAMNMAKDLKGDVILNRDEIVSRCNAAAASRKLKYNDTKPTSRKKPGKKNGQGHGEGRPSERPGGQSGNNSNRGGGSDISVSGPGLM